MPFIKVKSRLDEYKVRASMSDINDMSGRTSNPALTQYVLNNISEYLCNISGVLVDIGCGDGSLFAITQGKENCKFEKNVGILPSQDECDRVTKELKGFSSEILIKKGLSYDLPCPDNFANAVVINGVLLILDDREEVIRSIQEVHRIGNPSAIAYFGEMPFVNEMEGVAYGDSILGWLLYVLKNRGVYQFYLKVIYVLRCLFTKEIFFIIPKNNGSWFGVKEFEGILESCGFHIIESIQHKEIDASGKVSLSKTRWNYVTKVIK